MQFRKLRFCGELFIITLCLCSSPAMAIEAPPLSQIVKQSAKDCPVQEQETRVPLITWGGDIATVYANGGSATTAQDSIFSELGLKIKLEREDVFSEQVAAYLSCKSPYLRGTMGMINMAAAVADREPRTKLNIVYQMTWSAGGDALVVKSSIKRPADLKGKIVAVQAYGPHVDYLAKVLKDAGLSLEDVKILWTKDLTGSKNTPVSALATSNVDAALVIIPDALALTSNGTVGTGAEDSVKGAKILLSTKSANRIIADVYAVRSDYLKANRKKVQAFVHGLMIAQERLAEQFKSKSKKSSSYNETIRTAADILLDSPEAVADTEAMYQDAEFAGWGGNLKFFKDGNYPRNFSRLTTEVQTAFLSAGLISKKVALAHADWDYEAFKGALRDVSKVEAPRFDKSAVARVVGKKQQQGTLSDEGLFSFEVYFKPNQNSFSAELYQKAFDKVIDLSSTYGGALITVEGHSDPLGYLKKKKKNEREIVLRRVKQAAKNLSLTRANAVRDSLISFAKSKGVTLDPSQFAVVGHGINKPQNGICSGDPCAPKTEQEWLNNMRVEFRIIQIEAEESLFKPL